VETFGFCRSLCLSGLRVKIAYEQSSRVSTEKEMSSDKRMARVECLKNHNSTKSNLVRTAALGEVKDKRLKLKAKGAR
jgi:hypothetical protein